MNRVPWTMAAKLFRFEGRPGEVAARGAPAMEGSVAELVRHLRTLPSAELWRYSIATKTHREFNPADVRELMTRADLPVD